MKKVYQTIIDPIIGNCTVAALASVLDLSLREIPHFNLYDEEWFTVKSAFMYFKGYKLYANINPSSINDIPKELSINGCFMASVKSKTFKDGSHMVVMNDEGIVIHDPNPNEMWLGINLIDEIDKAFNYFEVWIPIEEEIVGSFLLWHYLEMHKKGYVGIKYVY